MTGRRPPLGIEMVDPDDRLGEVARRRKDHDVGSLPVWDVQGPVGILTDPDITVRSTAGGQHPRQIRVGDVTTPDPVGCYEGQEVRATARLMEEHRIRRLAVLRHEGRLVGIVSLADLAVRGHDPSLLGGVLRRVSAPREPAREHNRRGAELPLAT